MISGLTLDSRFLTMDSLMFEYLRLFWFMNLNFNLHAMAHGGFDS